MTRRRLPPWKLAYVGTLGRKLLNFRESEPTFVVSGERPTSVGKQSGSASTFQDSATFPESKSWGNSSYSGLVTNMQQACFQTDSTFLTGYTWSKCSIKLRSFTPVGGLCD